MPIYSMTGFASVQRETASGTLMIELRSVNSRYLELQLKMEDNLLLFDPQIRERVTAKLSRGKVECRLNLIAPSGKTPTVTLNESALDQAQQLSEQILRHFPQSRPLSIADILRLPGVLLTEEFSAEALSGDLNAALDIAIEEMQASRAREGAKLSALILDRAAQMEALVEKVKPMMPALIAAYGEKLGAKIRELVAEADEARIHQELVMYAQKIDVDEELGRLSTHLQELRRILSGSGSVGKRLDFLMQELNREANTLGSKSVSRETSQVSMELKVLIEQMREQVQNLE